VYDYLKTVFDKENRKDIGVDWVRMVEEGEREREEEIENKIREECYYGESLKTRLVELYCWLIINRKYY
jgi:hypothetical protein